MRPWLYFAYVATRIWLLHLWRGYRGRLAPHHDDDDTSTTKRLWHHDVDMATTTRIWLLHSAPDMTTTIRPWYNADSAIDNKDLMLHQRRGGSGVAPTSRRRQYADDNRGYNDADTAMIARFNYYDDGDMTSMWLLLERQGRRQRLSALKERRRCVVA